MFDVLPIGSAGPVTTSDFAPCSSAVIDLPPGVVADLPKAPAGGRVRLTGEEVAGRHRRGAVNPAADGRFHRLP